MKYCERCGRSTNELFEIIYVDDVGEKKRKKLCERCDWDIMNGRGKPDDDPFDVCYEHDLEDYEYDPIYYPKP